MAGIANYADLRAAIADELMRTDMTARIPAFVRAAHDEIVRWALAVEVMTLSADADTNVVLDAFPNAYLFGALSRAYSFCRDPGQASTYEALFQRELIRLGESDLALDCGLHPRPSVCRTP